MKLDLYQRVIVTQDFPDQQVKAGDIGWLIDYVHDPVGGEDGAILEIFNLLGESVDVAVVSSSAIEAVRLEHRPAARAVVKP